MDPVTLKSEAVVPAKRSKPRSYLPLDKRQFYHSQSGQPMTLDEVMSDRDSEDEVENDAAQLEDPKMLNDPVDENEDVEKFIQLWNSFVKNQRVLADGHIPWACEAFSRFHKKELCSNSSLNMCWRLFMIKQWKFGLVDAVTINKCNTFLQNYRNGSDSVDHPNDMEVDNNNNKSKDNEDKETTQVFETAPVPAEVTTHVSGIESTMCRNEGSDEMDVGVQGNNRLVSCEEQRESAPDSESSQDVDTTKIFQRAFGKRPIKITQKMKEMKRTSVNRGGRGRRVRGRVSRGGRGREAGCGNLV